jgi:hypothetical protein
VISQPPEAGWASWGSWSECGPGGVRSRTRPCALDGGKGELLSSSERCLVRGGGDLQVRDCGAETSDGDAMLRERPTLLAVRDLTQNTIGEPGKPGIRSRIYF